MVMFICSVIESNKCQEIPIPITNFKDHFDCVKQGYQSAQDVIVSLSREFVNKQGAYIQFVCKEDSKVST